MTANCSARLIVSSIALAVGTASHTAPARWPDICANALTRVLPGWRHAVPPPYYRDVLYLARAGSVHHNYDTYVDERITRDGISVSCFEKAGATYLYERGAWRFIVDSD